MDHERIAEEALVQVAKDRSKDIYDDGLKPVVQECGGAVKAIVGLFNNVVLYPIKKANITYKYKLQQFETDIIDKLKNTSDDKIIEPPINIAGPTLESLRYTIDVKELREMYLNLLVSSMNIDTTYQAHPSYVEIIRQLTSDEAKILSILPDVGLQEPIIDIISRRPGRNGEFTEFNNVSILGYEARCQHPDNIPLYINNLCRLGLVQIPSLGRLVDRWRYGKILDSTYYNNLVKSIPSEFEVGFKQKCLGITNYGDIFRKICLERD